jgi:hypothetical protein
MTHQAALKKTVTKKIPSELIYEVMDGKPLYFKGYKDVLNGNKTVEEIMATGKLQSLMLNAIQTHLLRTQSDKAVTIMTGEIGIHISKNQNFSCDLVVFEDATLATLDINQQYFEVPPKIIVEVDLQIDSTTINLNQYILKKTSKLLQFGVEKMIWIFFDPPLVSVALAQGAWTIHNWNTPIEIFDGYPVVLSDLFKEKNIKFEPIE